MQELKKLMQEFGIVGAGGAGFPSYAKLAEGADLLLINGAECEPLLATDYILLRDEMDLVLQGVLEIIAKTSISKAYIAVKAHNAERLGWKDGEKLADGVFARALPDVYPLGDEISLIYEATGRLIKPGKLPITEGIIVYNVETMYNLGIAKRFSRPVTTKWLTIGGEVKKPVVIKVPIGAKISDIFEKLDIKVKEGYTVIDGGPSMGKVINPRTYAVNKTTKGILILPDNSQAILSKKMNENMAISRAETACCQCTRCTDMCPRHLLGYPLEPHKMVRTAMGAVEAMPEMVISATLCCGCGVCESLACNQGISPRAVIDNYKKLLSKNRLRFDKNGDYSVKEEREYRMIPYKKWMSMLGVSKFDKDIDFAGEINDFSRVEMTLSRHIGKPSIPTVADGDFVKEGDLIASAADGLSLPQHASISGRVTLGNDKIIIDKVR
ncbi:MAG: NADH-quinone oxidoreductase subunit J [Ruminococcaceae bacterium]|nr:NADH-quinone oxidoreductase subunit J [Oscillospiraceae bacterium]